MSPKIKSWIKLAVSAFIGGGASAVTALDIDPRTFNLTTAGLEHIGTVALVGAVMALGHYLAKNPFAG